MTAKQRLVVVGNGMAGARLVEQVVAGGGRDLFEIDVFGDEPYGNYNRILLSSVLAGEHKSEDIFLNPLSWYDDHGVTLHAGVRVGWIDRLSKRVYAPGGVSAPYDKLVIATGSSPFVPKIDGLVTEEGGYKQGVFVFRTLDDCTEIMSYAGGAKRVAVIGGGLLGLEAARGLLNLGLEVHVVHLMPYLMEVQLDAAAGGILRGTLERMGLAVHLEKNTTAVLGSDRVRGIAFQDGGTLDCDMLVISAGIQPNVGLARQAGLHVQRGIVIHDDLSCRGDADVYAIGECAQHRGQVYGLVAPLWEQARVLAGRLTGREPGITYGGSKISTRLKVMGVDLSVVGEKEPRGESDEVVQYLEPARGIYKKLIIRENRVAGAIILGDGGSAPGIVQSFDRGVELPENRSEMLFPIYGDQPVLRLADQPDSAQICSCNGVSKGAIVAAVRDGSGSLAEVRAATRAASGCGSCGTEVQELIDSALIPA